MLNLGDMVAILTVAGIAIYVVGLVGLTLALRLRLTDDMSTAWYAVALLPRTSVAGQGVKIWLTWPIPFAALSVLMDSSIMGLTDSEELASSIIEKATPTLGLAFLSIFLVRVLYSMHKTGRYNQDLIGHFIIATIIAAFGGILMCEGALLVIRAAREAAVPLLDISVRGVLSGTIVFFIGGFLVGVTGAATVDHPLPRVQVATKHTTIPGELLAPLNEQLYIVAHADGHWHLLDDRSDKLLSVSNELVLAVRTTKDPSAGKPYSSTIQEPRWK